MGVYKNIHEFQVSSSFYSKRFQIFQIQPRDFEQIIACNIKSNKLIYNLLNTNNHRSVVSTIYPLSTCIEIIRTVNTRIYCPFNLQKSTTFFLFVLYMYCLWPTSLFDSLSRAIAFSILELKVLIFTWVLKTIDRIRIVFIDKSISKVSTKLSNLKFHTTNLFS